MLRSYRFLLCFLCACFFVFHLHAQAPAWVDAHSFGAANNDKTNHVLLDASNNALYICGQFQGANVDFDPSAGVANLTSNSGGANADIFIAKYNATTGAYIWAISVGGNTNTDAAIRMALDGAGNVYVCGTFAGTADFNPLGAPNNKIAVGTQDIFFARYNPGGLCTWATTIGAAATASAALDITVSGTDLYVTGRFTGSINFGGGNLMSAGVDDIFIGKYAIATGAYTNAIKFGGTGLDIGEGIIADGAGNVWVTGTLNVGGAVNFNPLGAIFNRTSAGGTDVFVAKYDATLNLVGANMAWLIGGVGADGGKSLAVDASNNIYVVGEFSGSVIDFDPSAGLANRNSNGGTDGFIASYTSAGAFRWVTTIGTTVGDLLDDVAVAGGNVYVCGGAGAAPIDFDGDPALTSSNGAGASIDAYLAWYDANTGAYKCGKRFIGAGASEGGLAITADAGGNIYWGGFYSSAPLDMDPRAASTQNFSNVGLSDAFVARYNPSASETYTWNSAAGAWSLPTNWTPQRDNPSADDILIFPAGGPWAANTIPFQQVGRLVFNVGSQTTLTAAVPGIFILANGDAAPFDVDVQSTAILNLGAGASQCAIRVTTGSVFNVAGAVNIASLPNNATYIGGAGTINITNTGNLSTVGPNGINGINVANGAVQPSIGGVVNYDPAASFGFTGKGITGFQAIGAKPAITQAKDIKVNPAVANDRIMLDNSVTLSGALTIGGPALNAGLSVTSANVLTLGPAGNIIDAATSAKVLEVINGTVNNPNVGGLTFNGTNPRLVLCSDGSMATAGILTGNPPTYNLNSQLEYIIKDANRTTTDVEVPTTMNGKILINGFTGTAPLPIVTLNNGKIFTETVMVSSGTLTLGGTTSVTGLTAIGNPAPTTGKINLNNQSLTLNGNMQTFAASSFIGSAASNLTLGDGNDTFAGNLTFDPGARFLNNYTVNLGAGISVNQTGDLSVGGTLTLTQGIITGTSPISFLRVTNDASGAVMRTNGWVAGPIERQLLPNITVDGTNYLFPVGDAVNYRPASLRNIRTGAGVPQIRMTYAATGAITFSVPVTGFASGQNWNLQTVSAGFTNSAIAVDNGAAPPANARVGQSGTQAGAYSTINGTTLGNVITSAPLLATPNQFYAVVMAPLPGPYLVAPAPVPATHSNITVFGAMTDITFSYNENMNPPAASNIFVHGSLRGYRTGAAFSQPSATQLRATLPAGRPLAPGEQVTVTVTNATSAVSSNNPRPHVYSFLAQAGIGPAQFFELQRPTVGAQPRSVVSADFNNDGRLDLCVANSGSNDLSVLLGGVGGVFGAPVVVPLPGFTSPSNIASADFNNDGNIDIAVSCSPNVCVLVGNGAGGFAAPVGYASGPGGPRYGLAARDFNGDGNVDILVGNAGAGTGNISVLPNTGAATFGAPISSPTIPNAFSVAVGDIDNDGDMDAVAVQSFGSNGITISVNNGVGIFNNVASPTLAAAYDVAMGDFNGDGWLDFAVSQYSAPNQVAVYLNTGYGVFPALPNSTYTTGDGVSSVVVGDYNGDGALDLITSNELSNSISVLMGNNTGAFSPAANFVTGAGPRSWSAAGDFDGDGDLDFATANFGNNSVSILLNTTQPRFVCIGGCGPVTYAPNITPQRNVNNALTASLLTWQFTEPMKSTSLVNAPEAFRVFGGMTGKRTGTWSYNSGTTTATLTPASPFRPGEQVMVSVTAAQSAVGINARPYVYQYRNRAGFGPATFYTVETQNVLNTQTWSIVTGYFNADPYLDVAVNGIGGFVGIEVFLGNASGGFTAGGILGGGTRYCGLEVADMNGDGTLDIVGATYGNPFGIHVFTNNGAGVFAAPLTVSSGLASTQVELAIADFDADGDLDVFAASDVNVTGGYAICLNNGTGLLSVSASSNFASAGNAFGAAAGDIDNDGDIDLAYSRFGINQAFTLINDGVGNFTAGQTLTVGTQAYPVRLADIDNDGLLDLLAVRTNAGTNNIQIFKNTAGVFPGAPTQTVALPGSVTGKILTFDANGDGFLDIAASEGATQSVVFILNNAGTFGTPVSTFVGNNPHALATGDIDGDGDLDLFVTNSASNAFTTLINGTQPRFVCTSGCGPVTYTPNVTPQRNVNNALTASLLTWQFTEPMTTATASFPTGMPPAGTNAPIRVWGSMTASRTPNAGAMGTWAYNAGVTTATLTPARPFFPGEQVMVSVTTARSTARIPVRPYTYSFRTKAGMGPAVFVPQAQSPFAIGASPQAVVLGDIDGDGDADMVVAGGSGLLVRLNNGAGNFSSQAMIPTITSPSAVALGDADNDGDLDIVVSNSLATSNVSILLNAGNGTFTTAAGSPMTVGASPRNVAWGDADGDGDLDIAVADFSANGVIILRNNGLALFTAGSLIPTSGGVVSLRFADIDNDGDMDIAAANNSGSSGLAVLQNDGLGAYTLLSGTPITTPNSPAALTTGDVDGDGDIDAIVSANLSGTATVLLNNGSGTYTVSASFATGAQSREVQLGDMDGDGDLDLIGVSANNNTVTVRLNNGLGDFTAIATAAPYTVGTSPQSVAVGDVDGDGDLDIVTANQLSNTASVLLNQGSNGLAFSLMNVTAQEGFNSNNPTVLSRTSTPFILGSFFGQTLLFPTTATLQYSIQAFSGGAAQFSIQGSSGATLTAATSLSTQATFVWNNAPVGGGSTQAIITVTPTGATGLNSTQITVTVIAAPAYPLVLAMSQSSSTGTHGVNAGAFNAGQLQVINGKPFNVAFGAWNGWGALAATQATVQAFLTGSGGETSGFTITSATIMLNNTASAIASNLAISWDVPLSISTTITLRLSITAGAFLQSTSVNLVLTTTPLEPVITSFSPTTGATTSVVTVLGVNLGNVTALRVGGVPVQTFTINSPTQISIVVSTGATGFITATNLAGTGQSLVPFTFVVPPSGLILSSTQASIGQSLTVSGNNITGAQNVFVGGIPAMFSVTMGGQILVIIPAGAQNGVVTVQTPGGSANSSPLAIIPAPSITAVSPTTVSGGGMITITGTNLTNVTSVTIGGIPVTNFMVISSTQIVAVVSTTAVSAPLQVQSAGGVAFSTTSIVVAIPPTVISVSNTMPTAGTQVFIGGSSFTPGMTVTIGGVPVPFVQVNSASEAIITMPSGATNGTLTVITPFGTGSFSSTISVAPGVVVPSSIDFTPVSGGTGTTVTIVGQGFVGVRDVSFGGVPVQRFTVESSTRIVAVISTGATGTARVVTTTGSAQSQRIFAFITPLQLDSIAAVSFFLMTDGFRWTTTANWLTRQPLQTWQGLTVQGGRITSIALPNNNVNGSLTSAVVQLSVLSALRTLNLSGNRLPGVLPSAIGTIRTLRTLNLSGVGLTGTIPTALASLDSLEVLRLDTNNLSGSIDTLLCSLGTTSSRQASFLREFRVNSNQLSGVIPPCVVEFRQLKVLHLQNNRFTGTIPDRIVELERLRELLLGNNQLSGTLPRTFDRTVTGKIAVQTSFFSSLERLDIGGNGFTGALPQGIAQFAVLRELRLQDNAFAGALPQTFTALAKLEIFDASRNRFTGSLPEDIGSLRRLRQFSFTNNSMSGAVPESLGECDLLERLELDSNALEGAMPTALATWQNLRLLGLSRNRLTSVPTLTAALTSSRAQFEALRLASNRLTFESIEGNAGLKNATYSPQDSIGTAQNLAFRPQSRIELNITIGGGSNRYQWFKNGAPFGEPSSSGFFLISQSATEKESGVYECRVTNSLAPALTLYSRAWQIRVDSSAQAPTQSDAVGQPTLLFPANNARFVSFAPLLRWSRGEGARQYEVQISTNASFTSPLTTAIVSSTSLNLSALQPTVRYYWRVRSLGGAGGSISSQSAWAQALFTTANTERPLQMSSIDFERVPLRETLVREAVVTNFSSIPQILRSIAILSDVQNDTNQVFRIVDDVRDAVIPAGQSLTVKIAFTPRVLGSTSATSVLAYQQRPQDGARLDSTRNILQGLGGGLKMDNVDFDTVRTGGTSIKSADLVNLSSRTIHLKRPTLPDALQTENGVFAIESYLGGDEIVLRPLDTVQVVVRCRVPESSVGRKLAGVLVFGEGDSVQASVRAIARPLRQNDIIVNVGVKPRVDNIPPGGLVTLDVFLRTNALTPVTAREVFRAIQPQFQGKFRMSRQVLALDGSEKIASAQILGDALSVIIPPTGLELSTSEAGLREARLLSVNARAVAGSTSATALQMESASLAMPLIRAASAVFVEEPIPGTFTAKISQAGGKRLIGSVQQNIILQAIATKSALEITYSIAVAGTVDVSLYDILGRKIQTLSESYQEAGAYNGIFRMDNLFTTPSGSYFIVLRTQSGIVQQRVDIIR